MINMKVRQTGLFICFFLVVRIIFLDGSFFPSARELHAVPEPVAQPPSPLSPLAMNQEQPALTSNQTPLPRFSTAADSQSYQTSLFLIGAVLLGLVIIGTMVLTRRE